MGRTDQPPLDSDLFESPEEESPEPPVMLYIPEHRFNLNRAPGAELSPCFTRQLFTSLRPERVERRIYLNTPVEAR